MDQARNASTALTRSFLRTPIPWSIIGTLLLLFVLVLSACGTSPSTTTGASTTSTSTTSKKGATGTHKELPVPQTGFHYI